MTSGTDQETIDWLLDSTEPAIRNLVHRDLLDQAAPHEPAAVLDGPLIRGLLDGQVARAEGRAGPGSLRVRRQEPEAPAAGSPEGSEVALVKRQDVAHPVSVGQHDEGGIGQADLEVGVSPDDPLRCGNRLRVERFEPIHAPPDLGEKDTFGRDAHPRCQQVVELGEHERRQDPRGRCGG